MQHYNHLAHTAKEESQAEYKRWVESYSVEQIEAANRARASLRRKLPSEKNKGKRISTKWPEIKDERRAKRPLTAYVQFTINRNATGDFRNIKISERAKLIGQEWKTLSEDEKQVGLPACTTVEVGMIANFRRLQKYKELEKQEHKRYGEEYSSVYGHPPPYQQPATTAAAAA